MPTPYSTKTETKNMKKTIHSNLSPIKGRTVEWADFGPHFSGSAYEPLGILEKIEAHLNAAIESFPHGEAAFRIFARNLAAGVVVARFGTEANQIDHMFTVIQAEERRSDCAQDVTESTYAHARTVGISEEVVKKTFELIYKPPFR